MQRRSMERLYVVVVAALIILVRRDRNQGTR